MNALSIFVGLGGNLSHPELGGPEQVLIHALEVLASHGVQILRRSRLYRTTPLPPSDQPMFVNAVVAVATSLSAVGLLALLHDVERKFGRVRSVPNAARVLDLDLLTYGAEICATATLTLPHPRLHERAFVIVPLAEIAPGWRHPTSGLSIEALRERLPPGQFIAPLM